MSLFSPLERDLPVRSLLNVKSMLLVADPPSATLDDVSDKKEVQATRTEYLAALQKGADVVFTHNNLDIPVDNGWEARALNKSVNVATEAIDSFMRTYSDLPWRPRLAARLMSFKVTFEPSETQISKCMWKAVGAFWGKNLRMSERQKYAVPDILWFDQCRSITETRAFKKMLAKHVEVSSVQLPVDLASESRVTVDSVVVCWVIDENGMVGGESLLDCVATLADSKSVMALGVWVNNLEQAEAAVKTIRSQWSGEIVLQFDRVEPYEDQTLRRLALRVLSEYGVRILNFSTCTAETVADFRLESKAVILSQPSEALTQVCRKTEVASEKAYFDKYGLVVEPHGPTTQTGSTLDRFYKLRFSDLAPGTFVSVNSWCSEIPRKVVFQFKQASAPKEVLAVDARAATSYLPSSLKHKMKKLGVYYIRNFSCSQARESVLPTWQSVLGSELKLLKQGGCSVEWYWPGSDSLTALEGEGPVGANLRVSWWAPAFAKCSKTGEEILCQAILGFHGSSFVSSRMTNMAFDKRPLHVTWGDGTEISTAELCDLWKCVRRSILRVVVKRGDRLVLDGLYWQAAVSIDALIASIDTVERKNFTSTAPEETLTLTPSTTTPAPPSPPSSPDPRLERRETLDWLVAVGSDILSALYDRDFGQFRADYYLCRRFKALVTEALRSPLIGVTRVGLAKALNKVWKHFLDTKPDSARSSLYYYFVASGMHDVECVVDRLHSIVVPGTENERLQLEVGSYMEALESGLITSLSEWQDRRDVAALHRVCEMLQYSEMGVWNHVSIRLEKSRRENELVMIPFMERFAECRASSQAQMPIDPALQGHLSYSEGLNGAASMIHRACYMACPDNKVVLHCHSEWATIAACQEGTFEAMDQQGAIFSMAGEDATSGRVLYADFGGIADTSEEYQRLREFLAQNVTPRTRVIFLKNHGVAVLGASAGEALTRMIYLERACRTNLCLMDMQHVVKPVPIPADICSETARWYDEWFDGGKAIEYNGYLRALWFDDDDKGLGKKAWEFVL